MSRIRTGLGPDDWQDQGRAGARVSGHGGRMIGQYVPASFTPQPHRKRPERDTPEQRERETARRRLARAEGRP